MELVDWMMIIYIVYLICVFFYLISLGLNFRIKHRRYVYNGIASIIERNLHPDNIEKMIDEIENLFDTCCRFYKDLYKVYPNVVFVLDDIHAVINTKIKSKIVNQKVVRFFNDNYAIFKDVHNKFREKYPFYEFTEKQQSVLNQIMDDKLMLEKLLIEFKGE